MADGKSECGGLSDRLRGMVSVYKLCKSLNMEFKIYFTNPFNLNEYLLPNIYDWTILPDEICYNKKEARPCFIWDYNNNTNSQEFWARHFLREKYKQIHLYTNKIFSEDAEEYGVLFKKLFKPTGELASLIDYHVKILNMGGGGDLSPLLLGLCSYWAILKKMTLCKYIWICQYCRTMKEGF
jgi:hypothetical protein